MISDLASDASGSSARFLALGRASALFWAVGRSFGIAFGGRNGAICKISGESTGFVASIAFAYEIRVFSPRFSDRLSALFSITLRSFRRLMAAARVG